MSPLSIPSPNRLTGVAINGVFNHLTTKEATDHSFRKAWDVQEQVLLEWEAPKRVNNAQTRVWLPQFGNT